MDKWKSKGKSTRLIREDSLLPPTRRVACQSSPAPLLDKRRHKKWSIDNIFKKFTSYLDAQSSSSSSSLVEDSSNRAKRKTKGKSSGKGQRRQAGYADRSADNSRQGIDHTSAFVYRRAEDLANANVSPSSTTMTTTMSHLEVLDGRQSSSHHSRSSDGSLDGRRFRKDNVKARVEAKRDQLCVGDSSMDESSNEDFHRNGSLNGRNGLESSNGKRRSRASRTERYMKRMCNGGSNGNGVGYKSAGMVGGQADTRSLEGRGCGPDEFQPIDRVPASDLAKDLTGVYTNGNTCPMHRYENDVINDNYYSRQTSDIGVNPLVQQTLQYFSEFDRNMAAQHKARKTYPGHNHQHNRRSHKSQPTSNYLHQLTTPTDQTTHSYSSLTNVPQVPPKPPSRDHRSRIFENPESLDKYFKYQHMMRSVPAKPPAPDPPAEDYYPPEKENRYGSRAMLQSPNTEVRNIIENRYVVSPTTAARNVHPPRSSPRSPLRESYVRNAREEKNVGLTTNDYRNSNSVPYEQSESEKSCSTNKRSSKNLEEALNELEAIYNSLQLGDEELLERAEKRSMEEFHYRGITATSPEDLARDLASRRRTWAESVMGEPDRLKDDMAYRRMHPKERPSSVDGQSSLSSISYLMTSPIPSRRDTLGYVDPKRKTRRKEPDVTLDDVVFRSIKHANNTLKIVEPQPPFGIPLGPITTAAESDYLHTNPPLSPRSRSPYIPSCEPDLVTDDLAYRNLRKDAQQQQQSSRQASPSFLSPSSSSPPLNLGTRKKRAVRSLSANLYGIINRNPRTGSPFELDSEDLTSEVNSTYDEYFGEAPAKCAGRRTSDPELLLTGSWRASDRQSLDASGRLRAPEQRKDGSSDLEVSSRSCDESSDERIQPQRRAFLPERDVEYKTGSDRGSSYLSSSCSSLPPLASSSVPSSREPVQPVTEQEISVYKKLCQDLENLVQLTKGIDGVSSSQEHPTAPQPPAGPERSPPPAREPSPRKATLEEMIGEVEREIEAESGQRGEEDGSPVKREISTILDRLRSLGDEEAEPGVGRGDSSCCSSSRRAQGAAPERAGAPRDVAKDTRDPEPEGPAGVEPQPAGRADDNPFFRNLELAKLSGDWRESTPKDGSAARRRTSLGEAGEASEPPQQQQQHRHWEGENRSTACCSERKSVSMVCNNASHDMSRLTAKYICYITNHVTAQFCLLLVFFLVLLLAIVTVP